MFYLAIAAAGYVSHYFLGNDNAVEQTAENLIENATGIDVDLSNKS